jgi:general secretion pathway protein B
MSILLEALRKSEQSKRPLEAPTIHAEQQTAVASEPIRKGPLALLLFVALILIAWIVWRQYQPPTGGYQPPVTLPANRDGAITTPVSTLQATDSNKGSGKVAKGDLNQQRTPVEKYRQAIRDINQPKASRSKPQPADADVRIAKKKPAKKPAGIARGADKNLAPISYWELPDTVRAEVPEMSFSVLVYATRPADRFVLVNGKRLQEGDSYRQGLVVKEIRRDGVVFSYRLYQFLVER